LATHAGQRSSAARLPNLWDDTRAAALSPQDLLVYRSNLLGADKRITNYGGGNTSSKLTLSDPLTGAPVEVMLVKGSGGDLGTIALDGFAALRMDSFGEIARKYSGPDMEDDVVALYPHCAFGPGGRAASIDTPLHALIDRPHVDHVHPDAIIAIAASADGEAITREIFGDDIGWLPWRRPGFELGVWLKRFVEAHPAARGVILASHGLFTWAETQKGCYETTLDVINKATDWLEQQQVGKPAFGGVAVAVLPVLKRREIASALMPLLRGLVSESSRKIGHFDDSDAVLAFVSSNALADLSPMGTSCPDHFLRTKIKPLVIDADPDASSVEAIAGQLKPLIAQYCEDYAHYYNVCKRANSPAMRDANPVVVLLPGVGMFTFAADKATARISAEFYTNAINVMRGATSISQYRGLAPQEAFDIEYWLLEEAKLQRLPKPKPLAGRVALITGGAGGIGLATAHRMAQEGACVVICDIDREALEAARQALLAVYGQDLIAAIPVDVTSEESVQKLFTSAALAFGGVDILVSNAGLASAAPIEDTSLDLWNKNMAVLSTGYFLVSREAFRLMKSQARGGAMVFIASKNALVASPNASAYCTAKASEIHLARCLALEGAPFGIRVNVVNPDAVLRGSRIWEGEWRAQRAEAYKVTPEGLEEIYRQRSMLKLGVYPEDIAEAAYFLASDLSSKSTGNILNVDAGHAPSFTR